MAKTSKESTKPTKIAYIVLGPESSGNRMMVRSFEDVGVKSCYVKNGNYVSGPHKPNFGDNPLLFANSLPYNWEWPNLINIYKKINTLFDKIYIIILSRKQDNLIRSQIKRHRTGGETKAKSNIRKAKRLIKELVDFVGDNATVTKIQYEKFVTDRNYRKRKFAEIGLSEPTKMRYFNANEK